ncbi:SusC/RagA family TonB-linked outer membrane protein [Larkinella soli]|uniref:SusC/RagA family TonB-linked outer membrane protein n=1 Tax=Larkinella soli TaxID=1770527 RepID=UPI001E5949FB|nr:SusC/RagA family TonB-linked outer membrane protein [Larkinella soli]
MHRFVGPVLLHLVVLLLLTGARADNPGAQKMLEQKISFHIADAGIEKVLEKLESVARVKFMYNYQIFSYDQKSTYRFREVPLREVLARVLAPHRVTFEVVNERIILKRTDPPLEPETSVPAEPLKRRLNGVILDEKGAGLPGTNVVIKGSRHGTATDAEGRFSLEIPAEDPILIISSLGYKRLEVDAGKGSLLSIRMEPETSTLNEVVVTALGITRDKKALAYSVAEMKGNEFTQARENNVANALTGKIAGVNVTGLSTGPGGSSRVIIRGNGSMTGANQPLYVVNGMPIDNTTPGGSPTTNGSAGNVDRGDGIAGINPDDIESISVLKGGTAAALYGSRAANGVILITTKKGKTRKGIGIEYNSTLMLENAAVFPDWQYEYGQGDRGQKPAGPGEAIQTGRRSWGARIDGSEYVAADGRIHSYTARKNNLRNFYQTGTTFTNTLAFTGGSENLNYRFSLSDLTSRSILPNTTFGRKTANLNLNGKLGERLSLEVVGQYNIEKGRNRPTAGDALGNPNWMPYMLANTVDIRWFAPGYDAGGNEIGWNDADIASNSYFVSAKYRQEDLKNRFIGQASAGYRLGKNLSVKGTVSRDFYSYTYSYVLPTGARYVPKGQYWGLQADVAETNSMLTVNYSRALSRHFGLTAVAGLNRRRYEYRQQSTTGSQFVIPYFYSPTNLTTSSTVPTTQQTLTNSVFGSADLDFKGFAYLTVTGRQDWFSTLSPKNNSIFYPAVGGSLVLSQALTLPRIVDFAKIRASWAQVGGATPDPYVINLTYSMVPSSGVPLQNVTSPSITNARLKPLTSTTWEVGLDLQLMKRRLGLDLTLYNRKTTDDIVNTALSPTTGYTSVILNVGELSNRGIEVLLTGTPVKTGALTWNVTYNVAYNRNQVIRLADGLNSIQMATTVNNYAYINNMVGKPYGTIVGTRVRKDAQGNTVYNPTTGYALATGLQELGNGVPPLTMGLTNEFSCGPFSLGFLVDGKFGNKVFSVMEVYAMRMGLLKTTLPGRENGLVLQGVTPEGDAYSRTVTVGQLRGYYDNQKSFSELFLHDGSFVKLRQMIVSYRFPGSWLKALKLQAASLSLVSRNLAILYRKTPNFDPESGYTNSSSQGFESFGMPRTRSYGLNLLVKL